MGGKRLLSTATRAESPPEPPPSKSSCSLCCCFGSIADTVIHETQMTAAALRAPPPIELRPGHANEEGEARGMAGPRFGAFECVNKNKEGEIICILAATNAVEVVNRDVYGNLAEHLRSGCMPAETVVSGEFDASSQGTPVLEVVLFYGAKYNQIERVLRGEISRNFEFTKAYRVHCHGKNVLLKYKQGELHVQRGAAAGALGLGKKVSQGGSIDMRTNVDSLEPITL